MAKSRDEALDKAKNALIKESRKWKGWDGGLMGIEINNSMRKFAKSMIKLDYDCSWNKVLKIMRNHGWLLVKLNFTDIYVWKTKKGYHVEAEIPRKLRQEQILLSQILLESDKKREILNYLRLLKHKDMMNFLFDRKIYVKKGKVKLMRTRKRVKKMEEQLIATLWRG